MPPLLPASVALGANRLDITTPIRGAVWSRSNPKLEPDQTQWVSFVFDTVNLYQRNPNAHLWVMLDGQVKAETDTSLVLNGRGIAIGDTEKVSGCTSVAFEHFGGRTGMANEHPGGCANDLELEDNIKYKITVHASKTWVAYWIWRCGELAARSSTFMPDILDQQSSIALGVAFDDEESRYTISDLTWGTF